MKARIPFKVKDEKEGNSPSEKDIQTNSSVGQFWATTLRLSFVNLKGLFSRRCNARRNRKGLVGKWIVDFLFFVFSL